MPPFLLVPAVDDWRARFAAQSCVVHFALENRRWTCCCGATPKPWMACWTSRGNSPRAASGRPQRSRNGSSNGVRRACASSSARRGARCRPHELFAREFEVSPQVGTAADFRSLLTAAGWPDAGGAVLVVGHQPTLGQAASFLLTGQAADLSFKKGALWWISTRERGGVHQSVLKASITAELADGE